MPEKKKKKQKVVILNKASGKTGTLYFEQCETYNGNQYYITHKNGAQYKNFPVLIIHEDEKGKLIHRPFPEHAKYPFNLQSRNLAPEPYGTVLELFQEIRQYFYDHWDYIDGAFYDILAAWVLATYLPEKWDFIAYIGAIGDSGTGKTRMLNCLAALSYKGLLTTDPTEASLFRSVTAWNPTLLIDESETVTKSQRQSVQNIMNAGQKRGVLVQRSQEIRVGGVRDYQIQLFDVFGFKAIAGTKMWLRTLRRRALIAFSSKETRKIVRKLDKERARELRRKLLQYRIDYVDIKFTESEPKILELTNKLSGDVFELFFALFSVTPTSKWNSLLKYAYKEEAMRSGERSVSEMAEIFYAILKLKVKDSNRIKLSVIADYLNREKLTSEMFKTREIGTIASLLGFQKKHTRLGSVIIWNTAVIERLKKQYGFFEEEIGEDVTEKAGKTHTHTLFDEQLGEVVSD